MFGYEKYAIRSFHQCEHQRVVGHASPQPPKLHLIFNNFWFIACDKSEVVESPGFAHNTEFVLQFRCHLYIFISSTVSSFQANRVSPSIPFPVGRSPSLLHGSFSSC